MNVFTSPANSPFFRRNSSVRSVMLRTLAALLPGLVVYVAFFGGGVLAQVALASATALLAEAFILRLRQQPVWRAVSDGSALLTAWLLALAIPPMAPWWLVVSGTLFAIIIAKHLYGGLGQNPFNPAMAAWCALIVSWPALMAQWPVLDRTAPFAMQWQTIFATLDNRHLDAWVSATPLDLLRTATHGLSRSPDALARLETPMAMAGAGWLWIACAYLGGGLFLLQQRIISWHTPVAFLGTLAIMAGIAHQLDPLRFAGPLFQVFSGGAMLGAFFILTDPVSSAATPRGKLIFAAGAAALVWIIRHFGAYPDGVGFATLIMNLMAPLIDRYTQPPVFGHKRSSSQPPQA